MRICGHAGRFSGAAWAGRQLRRHGPVVCPAGQLAGRTAQGYTSPCGNKPTACPGIREITITAAANAPPAAVIVFYAGVKGLNNEHFGLA